MGERRDMMNECHVVPDITYNAKQERIMRKTATYGVVALFKAVAKHQMDIKRSFEGIDEENDVLQRKTMRIEQQSTDRLISSLNEASTSQKRKGAMIQTPNLRKRRRLNTFNAQQKDALDSDSSNDSVAFGDDNKEENKQWSVLNENMIFESSKSHKQSTMDGDSEFDDDFEDDSN